MAPKKKEDDDDDVSSVEIDDDAEEPEEVRSLGNQKNVDCRFSCVLPACTPLLGLHCLTSDVRRRDALLRTRRPRTTLATRTLSPSTALLGTS